MRWRHIVVDEKAPKELSNMRSAEVNMKALLEQSPNNSTWWPSQGQRGRGGDNGQNRSTPKAVDEPMDREKIFGMNLKADRGGSDKRGRQRKEKGGEAPAQNVKLHKSENAYKLRSQM